MYVAIHNKNGQGLLHAKQNANGLSAILVAIHNKNGQGLLLWLQEAIAQSCCGRNPQ